MTTSEEILTRTRAEEGRRGEAERLGVEAPRVVLPVDGSDRSLVALPIARALAELQGATLHVLHVAGERPHSPRGLMTRLGLRPEDLSGAVLDEVLGEPAEQIVTYAGRSPESRIVMVTHSDHASPGTELGSVAEEVLRTALCPVLLVRPERGQRPWRPRRVLIPHDGAAQTAGGFGPAFELARQADGKALVLHVAGLMAQAVAGQLTVPTYVDQPHYEWPDWRREFLWRIQASCGEPAGLESRLFLSSGEPGREILRFAAERDVDLIAIAWHGSLASSRAATLKQVILDAPCPVLFLHVGEAETEDARSERVH